MVDIHFTTIFLLEGPFLIILGLIIINLGYRHSPTFQGIGNWGNGIILSGVGIILLSLQNQLHPIISIIIANIIIFVGVALTIRGVIRFDNRRPSNILDISLVLIVLLVFVVFTFIYPSLVWRIIFASLVALFLVLRFSFHLLHIAFNRRRLSYYVAAIPVVLSVFVIISRIYHSVHLGTEFNVLTDDPNQMMYIAVFATLYVFWGIGSTLVISEEMRLQLAEALVDRERALDRFQLLLREMNHRIKNNLAILQGILGYQTMVTSDPESKASLSDSQNRIEAMSTIHEMLTRSEDLKHIDLAEYLKRLTDEIIHAFDLENRIELTISCPSIQIDFDIIVPLALIINELVSNAYKYAFPEQKTGKIEVKLMQDDQGFLVLTVLDNGVGLPVDFNWQEVHSLGLGLVHSSAQQLQGRVEIQRMDPSGTVCQLTFPMPSEKD